MSYSNTIGQISTDTTKLTLPLEFPDGSIQSTAVDGVLQASYQANQLLVPLVQPAFSQVLYNNATTPSGWYLYSVEVSVSNNDTAQVVFSNWNLDIDTPAVTTYSSDITTPITLAVGQTISRIYTIPVKVNGTAPLTITFNCNISSGAFATNTPSIGFRQRSLLLLN